MSETDTVLSLDELPESVLCIAPSVADATRGAGGVLAGHAGRGDGVRLVVLGEESETGRAAAAALGVTDVTFLGFEAGRIASQPEVVSQLRAAIEDTAAELVYAPSPLGGSLDERTAFRAYVSASRGSSADTLAFGSDGAARFAVDGFADRKAKALSGLDGGAASATEETFTRVESERLADYAKVAARTAVARAVQSGDAEKVSGLPRTTAVVSTWNKKDDVRANVEALLAQTLPFESIVVVDNASTDGTKEMLTAEFPEVRLVVMPNSDYGACETFNIGFACAATELTAILDDDVVLPPDWLEKSTLRLLREPDSTAIVSTKIVEPGMPESFKTSPEVNRERYMSTFRGCASLARSKALAEAGGYDERLFIYGNERDLTCRLLNLGYRVLQFPEAEAFHKTPFGIKMGKRSLYYHARNAWLGMLKYAPLSDLLKMPFLVVSKILFRSSASESKGDVTDATGTIGIGRSIRETPGAWWVLIKAGFSVLYNVPYCLKRRQPVRSPDFELPIH